MRKYTVLVSFVVGAFAIAVAAPITMSAAAGATNGAAEPPNGTSGDLSNQKPCVPWRFDNVRAVDERGSETEAQASDNKGRRYYMTSPSGVTATQTVPPAGFRPESATDTELELYGFPVKPTDAQGLARWTDRFSNYAGPGVVGYCETDRRNNTTSGNWAGHLTYPNSGKYVSSEAEWYQTAFDYACPGSSGYSTWSGLGGYYDTSRLLQSGTDVAGQSINGIYPWWEAIGPNHVLAEQKFAGNTIGVSDDTEAYTTYYTDNSVSMSVYDHTKGLLYSTGRLYSIDNVSASTYYDGSSVEAITEAPGGGPAPGNLFYLRKPHLGNTEFLFAGANGRYINLLPGFGIDEHSDFTGNYMQIAGPILGYPVFYDYWYYCS